ncbi:LysM peptidoglycan-binding domain-containing protein [Salinicoccus siamensis]|uniref:LysM peptidoglycan-binding domain-containing protein n=1 Tax=Salinicoccus siamensis TaxID=381830 RepID=A0ABV5Z2H4_9STAP
MKDDFYKDINHKRTPDEKKDEKHENGHNEKKDAPRLSRAERHKQKDKTDGKTKRQPLGKTIGSYINRESIDKQKTFFLDKFSSYKERFRDEINVSKKKFGELKRKRPNVPKNKKQDEDGHNNRRLWPIIVAGVFILPITIALGIMITSNFWPDDPSTQIADQSEENSEEAAPEARKELEEKKAQKEKEIAQAQKGEDDGRSEEKNNDLGTGTSDFSYSEEQQSELNDAAEAAIEEKKSGDASDTPDSPVTPLEEESGEQPEEATQETGEEQSSVEESTQETDQGQAGSIGTYTVRPNDNLYRIALRFYGDNSKENIDKILEANGINDHRELSVGQELTIPE